MCGLSSGGGRGVVTGDPALHSFHWFAIAISCDSTLRYLTLAREFFNCQTHLIQWNLGRRGNLAIKQLTVFFQVLENDSRRHFLPFQVSELHLFHERRFQLHGADTIDLAIDIMVSLYQADVLDLCPHLDHQG